MGQHKYNPTAIAAKNGEIEPKIKRMSRAEKRRMIETMLREKTGLNKISKAMGMEDFYG